MKKLPQNNEELLQAIARGETFDYLHFWGHRSRDDDRIGPGCLSQWYAKGFHVDGEYFETAEHWMMAAKARLFGDEVIREQILANSSPQIAKQLGRRVSNFDPVAWDEIAFQVVCEGNFYKFSQHRRLKAYLLSTDPLLLVEASPYDVVWGIGMADGDARARQPAQWQGKNKLGYALMLVRQQLLDL
ncbi:MAG: DUF1768 domain-containing protein [Bacteroidetes bacterium]|nr:MAG: DUF1768 domain-containing protein [Bacteroidota bacterium]PTM12539.1 MAG: DUF1768 domain-containing protein [Bacteroidota bacterium]